jgi:carboxyl-terminal processing protease
MSDTFKLVPLVAAFLSVSVFASTDKISLSDLPELKPELQHITATKRINNLFARSHYKHIKLNNDLSSKIYDRFIELLDGNKSLFLQSDLNKFEHFRFEIDDSLAKGDLTYAYEIYNFNVRRRFARLEYYLTLLEKEMPFDVEDDYFFDREDAQIPQTFDELHEIWRQSVKYDALRLKLTGKDWQGIKEVLTKRYRLALKRLSQVNSEDIYQVAMNSFAGSIEAHTSYLSPRRAEQFKQEMQLELEGIGAVLGVDEDYTVIRSLVPGGPASKTEKLKSDDRIIAVAQDKKEFVDIIGWRLDDVVDLIKGPKGTTVRLQYLKGADSHGTPQVVEIVRDKIRLEDKAAKSNIFKPLFSEVDSKIGVIEIPGFYNNLSKDVKKELSKLQEQNVDGIIIDLRGNGGGSLYEATQLSGLFFDKGPVVQIHNNDKIMKQTDRDGVTYFDGPLTVLVDRYSASASEIFAAAMQDYGRAIIIGEQTFGKGTVQQHRPLNKPFDMFDKPLGSVQYTIAKFYRINGDSTQHKGVIPDIIYPSPIDPADWGESLQQNALPWDQIRSAKYNKLNDLSAAISTLSAMHKSRIDIEPEFNYLLSDIAEYQKEKDRESITLVEAKREKQREENKVKSLTRANERLKRLGLEKIESLDDAPEVLDEIDPGLEEAVHIMTDFIKLERYAKS